MKYKYSLFKKGKKDDKIMIGQLLISDRIKIGNRIREAREQKHLTQMKLAELVELSTITISNIESGKVSPNLKNIISISKALGVSIDSLVADENYSLHDKCINEINIKLSQMDEIGVQHINKYIELYIETEKNKEKYI